MARDRFGFLERRLRKLFRRCIAASDPWSPIDAASSNQLREMCDVVDNELRFNCVSTRPEAGQMVRLLLRLLQVARQCFARTFVRRERTIRYCRMRGRGETIMSTKV